MLFDSSHPITHRKPSDTHIIVGMSGGVDSSVAALLLRDAGFSVSGLFMKNWEEDDTEEYCAAAEDMADAQLVCKKLGIELTSVNFAAEYWDRVFEHFLAEYAAGRTPNPDILCNREIKFHEFLLQADTLGADYIATGHYVASDKFENQYRLRRGADGNKDQSYFLYTLGQHQLKKSLFPLGEINKPRVRAIAESAGLITHNKKDSTGICFIGERRFDDFLERYLPPCPGEMRSDNGQLMGVHQGLMYHTIGQRHGLNIGGPGEAWYVAGKNLRSNTLIVVQGHDHPGLLSDSLIAAEPEWVGDTPIDGSKLMAKTRYRQADQACTYNQTDDGFNLKFDNPQRAVTPGQAVVLYEGRNCLGGGTIMHANSPLLFG
jgi:tRNA-uridine 2-sulfurtransferase